MIRINLLPHREQKKAAHRLRFQLLLGSAFGVALLIVGLSYFILDTRESHQEERNQFLQAKLPSWTSKSRISARSRSSVTICWPANSWWSACNRAVMMPCTFSTSWCARRRMAST
jgi:Tfp pilus assembly protein PilN